MKQCAGGIPFVCSLSTKSILAEYSMRIFSTITVLCAVALAGCSDLPAPTSTPATQSKLAVSLSATSSKIIDMNNDEYKQRYEAALAKLRAKYGDPDQMRHPDWGVSPTYVLVSDLPAGVQFQVIRDPSSATPRMIVLAESTLTDDLMYAGVSRLAMDERSVRTTTHVRTLTMFQDGHYEVFSDGKVTSGRVRKLFPNVVDPVLGRGADSKAFLREASKHPPVEIAPGRFGQKFKPSK